MSFLLKINKGEIIDFMVITFCFARLYNNYLDSLDLSGIQNKKRGEKN